VISWLMCLHVCICKLEVSKQVGRGRFACDDCSVWGGWIKDEITSLWGDKRTSILISLKEKCLGFHPRIEVERDPTVIYAVYSIKQGLYMW
jgi:hypothetical protein